MLSILVCHSYFLGFDQKQKDRAKPYPPLATLQVASMLRAAGHEVALFDAMLADDLTRFARQLEVLKPQLVLVYEVATADPQVWSQPRLRGRRGNVTAIWAPVDMFRRNEAQLLPDGLLPLLG